jgi:type II restriction/modification system DNA methylase subunit YeeA
MITCVTFKVSTLRFVYDNDDDDNADEEEKLQKHAAKNRAFNLHKRPRYRTTHIHTHQTRR